MPVSITTRAENAGPLSATQMDTNLTNLETFVNQTRSTVDSLTDATGNLDTFDGSLINNGTVEYGKLKNIFYAEDTSTVANSITFTVTGEAEQTTISAGDIFLVKVLTANTGVTTVTPTMNSTILSALPVKKNLNEAMSSAEIKAGEIVVMVYDGTNMQLVSDTKVSGLGIDSLAHQTHGSLISYNATAAELISPGTAGKVLTSQGAGALPNWTSTTGAETIAAITFNKTVGNGSGGTTDFVDAGTVITITATSTYSKLIILYSCSKPATGNGGGKFGVKIKDTSNNVIELSNAGSGSNPGDHETSRQDQFVYTGTIPGSEVYLFHKNDTATGAIFGGAVTVHSFIVQGIY